MRKSIWGMITAILLLPFFTGFSQAQTLLHYPRLYRGMRSLGMGGAFTAVRGDIECLFYNPAGVSDMPLRVDLLSLLVEADDEIIDVGQDISDALDIDDEVQRLDEITRIIDENLGNPLHARVSLLPSVTFKNFAGAFLAQGEVDARPHNVLSSEGVIEVDGGVEGGPVAAFSFSVPVKGLRFGIGGKWIYRKWVDQTFTAQQIASENFDFADFDTSNSDYSFDLALMYDLPFWESVKPVLGLAYLNITDLDFNEGGEIPATLNLGLSASPEVKILSSLLLTLDVEDLTQEYREDDSFWKRFHAGAEAGLLKKRLFLRAGINQGYPTAGVEFDFWIIKVGYAFYSEEIGAYAGQDRNTRHLLQLVLGI